MQIWKFILFMRQDGETTEAIKGGWERVKEIKDYTFSAIEGSIVLGATQAAASVSSEPTLLLLVYWIGWAALALYLLTGAKAFLAVWFEERGPDPENRPRLAKTVGVAFNLLSAAIAIGIPYLLPAMIAAVIQNKIF